MKSLLILGRQPALGMAELEAVYGAKALKPVGLDAVLLDVEPADVAFNRLGGSIKLSKVLTLLDSTDWQAVEDHLGNTILEHLEYMPEGKFRLGLSAYGLRVRAQEINASALRLKKIIKAEGRSVRVVPNKQTALNSAQVLHNQLTSPTGWELIAVRFGQKTILAQTIAEQDIEAYADRDQNRPKRDARVGMLPPKLAQILINLAVGEANPSSPEVLLDPFCGTGVVLQEAILMGIRGFGSDLEPKMIEYSKHNLSWLMERFRKFDGHRGATEGHFYKLEVGDATRHTWQPAPDFVACETYLGPPLTALPSSERMRQIEHDISRLHNEFLKNIGRQIKPGTRLCLAVPAWKTKQGFLHLKTLAKLADLGYTRLSFVHARDSELIYHRPDQIVARELVLLEKR